MKIDRIRLPRLLWFLVLFGPALLIARDGLRLQSIGLILFAFGLTFMAASLIIRPPVFYLSLSAAAKHNVAGTHKHQKIATFLAFLGVKSRLFLNAFNEEFGPLCLPFLERLDRRLVAQSTLRDEMVVG